MRPPAANNHLVGRHTHTAKPVSNKPKEWNWCCAKAVCTTTGTLPANTGKWAKAALSTTLAQALMAPKTRNQRAERGQTGTKEEDKRTGKELDI